MRSPRPSPMVRPAASGASLGSMAGLPAVVAVIKRHRMWIEAGMGSRLGGSGGVGREATHVARHVVSARVARGLAVFPGPVIGGGDVRLGGSDDVRAGGGL